MTILSVVSIICLVKLWLSKTTASGLREATAAVKGGGGDVEDGPT